MTWEMMMAVTVHLTLKELFLYEAMNIAVLQSYYG